MLYSSLHQGFSLSGYLPLHHKLSWTRIQRIRLFYMQVLSTQVFNIHAYTAHQAAWKPLLAALYNRSGAEKAIC